MMVFSNKKHIFFKPKNPIKYSQVWKLPPKDNVHTDMEKTTEVIMQKKLELSKRN